MGSVSLFSQQRGPGTPDPIGIPLEIYLMYSKIHSVFKKIETIVIIYQNGITVY